MKTATFANQVITRGTAGPDAPGAVVVDGDTEINVNAALRFDADWAISGQVLAGDTFEVPVPYNDAIAIAISIAIASTAPFNLTKGTTTLATCVYDMAANPATPANPGKIVCTFAPGGPYANPSGDIWFVGRLQLPPPGDPDPPG